MEPISRYRGIEAFYEADPRRRHSSETDYGVMWSDGIASGSSWRLSWVEVTGEVYAFELGSMGMVVALAERLRRQVVEHALARLADEHLLSCAWLAVGFPPMSEGWSGYVEHGKPHEPWVVERGWWERPLVLSEPASPPNPTGAGGAGAGSGATSLARSILADYLGHPVSHQASRRFGLDVIASQPVGEPIRVAREDIAAWLEAVDGGGKRNAALERV